MKKLKIVSLILIFTMLFTAIPAVQAQGNPAEDEIPKINTISGTYGYSAYNVYTSDDAPADVPNGYTGYVAKVVGGNGSGGFSVGFAGKHIAKADIAAITLRLYYTNTTYTLKSTTDPGIRFYSNNGTSWAYMAEPDHPNEWTTVTITPQTKYGNSYVLDLLCNDSGELGNFAIGFRCTGTPTVYIDYLSVTLWDDVKDEIPFTTDYVLSFDTYIGNPTNVYTEDNGTVEGVPAGYSGYVMKLTNKNQTGVSLDFSDKHIARDDIQSINFRIYYEDGAVKADGVRVKEDTAGSHWGLYAPISPAGQWTTLTVTNGSKDSEGNNLLDKLCPNGELGKVGLGFRFSDSNSHTCYVDYVSVTRWSDIKEEIPFTANDIPDFTQYVSSVLNDVYDEEGGAAAGIPAGYTGYVMKLTGTNQTGMAFDFSDKNIARADLLSIDFRVYYAAGIVQSGNGLRVKENTSGVTWALYPPSDPGTWTTLTVTSSDLDTQGNNLFDKLCPNGILGKVGLGFRLTGTGTCYVDYVRVNIKTTVNYDDVKVEIPYVDNDVPDFSQYVSSALNDVYTEESGAAAGVPAGYTGYVMKLTNSAATGLAVDFTDQQIPLSVINAVNIRMYYPDVIKVHETDGGIRIKYNKPGAAWKLYNPEYPEQWTVFSITDRNVLANLCDENGDLSKFAIGFRFTDSAAHSCYIDYVSVDIKPDDGVAPVITYNGPLDINTTANKPFVINASAYDEYEERRIPIDFFWSSDPFDENGKLTEGSYTCTMSATDFYGNRSADIVLNVTVGAADTQAPVIHFDLTEIYSIAGCTPVLNVSVTDDNDDVALEIIWSVNALDARGRLTEGDHTLILRSKDLTGNTAEMTVAVHAGAEFSTVKPIEYEQ